MQEIHILNSLTKKKEVFKPIAAPHVGMYVCGPTVYSYVHLGNCRTFISFDMIRRYLNFAGYKVRFVRNITDAGHLENDADEGEDKISQKARLESLEPMEIVQKYTLDFHDVMRAFNNLAPDIEPTATGHIVEQIDMIQDIMDKGLAYEANGSVYFDVHKYNETDNYGILSGRKVDELLSNTRELDGQSEKKNPADFALWKKASPSHIMRWNSPWSVGFPGWHLECSVMSSKYLGENFDIHGGGMDLKFPHHECEIAQCKASNGVDPVNYWMHANMLTLNGQKMSKSTGNTLTPVELFHTGSPLLDKTYDPIVVRFFMMQAHYTSILDFSSDALNASEKGFFKISESIEKLASLPIKDSSNYDFKSLVQSFYNAMNDDFNTPILIAQMFEASKTINKIISGEVTINQEDHQLLSEAMNGFFHEVMGLKVLSEESAGDDEKLDHVIQMILKLRQEAKANRNFALADQLRDELKERGITIKDSKEGSTWVLDTK